MRKIIVSTFITLLLGIVPVFAVSNCEGGISPYADMTHKSSSRTSESGVKLTFQSQGNYTSSGVIVGGMTASQKGNNIFNYFADIKMTKKNGTVNPYAKCTFRYVSAGLYTDIHASVNEPLKHKY